MTKLCQFIGMFFVLCLFTAKLRADDVGGALTTNTIWSPAQGTVTVTSSVVVPAGARRLMRTMGVRPIVPRMLS